MRAGCCRARLWREPAPGPREPAYPSALAHFVSTAAAVLVALGLFCAGLVALRRMGVSLGLALSLDVGEVSAVPEEVSPLEAVAPRSLPVAVAGKILGSAVLARVAGFIFRRPEGPPFWYQDLLAWVALLAVLGLGAEVLIQTVINPSLPEDKRLDLPAWQGVLSAVVGFYFGARS